jgi:ABC-type sugar transport system substrate-binding protein
MKRWIAAVLGLWLAGPVWAISVVFINPGKSDEVYWKTASRAMEAAARSLDLSLEVRYAEREPLRVLSIAREIVDRPPSRRPDYAIVTNDYATGPELLKLFDSSGIRVLMAYSGISSPQERAQTGAPRERYRHWIGSLEPHAETAGELTARALIEAGRAAKAFGPDGKLHLIAIAGDRSTPSSLRRTEGMRRVVEQSPDVVLEQEVLAAWQREKAAEQSTWLYQRYPAARLVWAGNDLMAFGAMESWEARGGKPGVDAFFSGVNTSREALDDVIDGRLAALAGGHFICGAWALVMIYDHAHGHDFADEGLELDKPMFTLFTPAQARVFEQRFGDLDFRSVDFRRFSRAAHPGLRHYDFDFGQLLR